MANPLSTIAGLWQRFQDKFFEHPMYEDVLQRNASGSLIFKIVAKDGRKYVALKIKEPEEGSGQITLEPQSALKLHRQLARYLSEFKSDDPPDD